MSSSIGLGRGRRKADPIFSASRPAIAKPASGGPPDPDEWYSAPGQRGSFQKFAQVARRRKEEPPISCGPCHLPYQGYGERLERPPAVPLSTDKAAHRRPTRGAL